MLYNYRLDKHKNMYVYIYKSLIRYQFYPK